MKDPVSEICRILENEGSALLAHAETMRKNPKSKETQAYAEAVKQLNQTLSNNHKIVVTGVGKSGIIAKKISATLASTGSLSVFMHPTEGFHGDLGIMQKGDTLLALSYTGNSEELVRLIPTLKNRGVFIIGLGGKPESKLAAQSDLWLQASIAAEACPLNLAPTTSTTLMLAIGDALAMTLMQIRGFNAEGFARNHPGGALGKRLELRVADLMHSGKSVGTVSPSAPVDEILMISTQTKLGGVIVLENNKLVGLITDGDIRRALQKREKFFSLSAKEIMTAQPITIVETAMAYDALELMENRPSQISVLPVLNTQGQWTGLVRVHDLVKTL